MLSSTMHIPGFINYFLKNYNKQYGLNLYLFYSYAHSKPFLPPILLFQVCFDRLLIHSYSILLMLYYKET